MVFLLKIYFIYQYNTDMNKIKMIYQEIFPDKEYNECTINNDTVKLYINKTNNIKSKINNIKQLFGLFIFF